MTDEAGRPNDPAVAPITLVTVFFEAEIALLRLQARSLRRFVGEGDFSGIILIDNTRNGITDRVRSALLDEYGPWRSRVVLLRPDDICAVPPCRGWIHQQVLKLMVHEHVGTPFFLVLDAKNHWIRRTTPESFVNPDGRARGGSHPYRHHPLRGDLVRVLDYVGVDPEPWIDSFPVTHTPVVMSTDLVRRMTAEIAGRGGRTFAAEFVAADLTEFFLYSGWLIATFGGVDKHIDGTVIHSANLWPETSRHADFVRVLAAGVADDAPFLSVHRTALAKAGWSASNVLVDFWIARGLFTERRRALTFIAEFKARYLVTMSIRKARTTMAARRTRA